MSQTFPVTGSVELAVVERSGFVESRHAGAAIVLAPDGTVVEKLGDTSALVLPRSSLKPVQALACVTAGAELDGERLGLATASHSGTDRHVAVVRDILTGAGLGEDDLGCPEAWPRKRPAGSKEAFPSIFEADSKRAVANQRKPRARSQVNSKKHSQTF